MTDNSDLQRLLDTQESLQRIITGESPGDFLPENVNAAVHTISMNVLALTDELHELLAETSWKPWAKGDYINLTAAKSEAIDALHFLLNIFLTLGMDADEVLEKYIAKNAKNISRQEAGYDGVSTKCPGCKRALDDDGVECYLAPQPIADAGPDYVYCAKLRTYVKVPA